MIYEPAEDSFLLGKYVSKLARGKVLEVGVGSGYLMEAALKKTKNVKGVDIDREAVEFCKNKKLDVIYSDVFNNVKGKFDVIILNPPYLPQEESMKEHKDLFGGKKGWEIIERFFKKVDDYLEDKGEILIIFSNLTNKKKVDSIITKKFEFEELESKNAGLMEKLFVYRCYR